MGVAEGVAAGCLMVFSAQFITALFFGRLFCAWLCPGAGLQEACFPANDRSSSSKYDWLKYLIWIP